MILLIIQSAGDRFDKIPESAINVRTYVGNVRIGGFDSLIETNDWFDLKVLEDLEGIISGDLCPGPEEFVKEIRENILGAGIVNLTEGNHVFINRRIYRKSADGWKRVHYSTPKIG